MSGTTNRSHAHRKGALTRACNSAVLICGLLGGGVFSARAASTFDIETVDPRLTDGGTALAIDHLGRPRIAYRVGGGESGSNGDLFYASRESGGWILDPIDTLGDVGWGPSLVIDASDTPHISYVDFTHNEMKYATRFAGSWVIETVEAPPPGYFVQQGSLALDSAGEPHVAYYVNNVPLFRYASRNAGTWSVETIAPLQFALWLSLAIDASDVPHVSAWDAANHVRYATKASGTWSLETIDTLGNYAPGNTSMSLDSGAPWVAYSRPSSSSDGDLALATRGVSGWTHELVDTSGTTGFMPSLRFHDGEPCISYFDGSRGSLRYARREAGNWTLQTVDSLRNSGFYSSLGVDSDGRAWISYIASDASNQHQHLMAAHEGPTTGVPRGSPVGASDVEAWPNPATSSVRVSFSLAWNGISTLALYDLAGRAILTQRLEGPTVGSRSLSLPDLPPGLYHIVMAQAGRCVARKLAIVR